MKITTALIPITTLAPSLVLGVDILLNGQNCGTAVSTMCRNIAPGRCCQALRPSSNCVFIGLNRVMTPTFGVAYTGGGCGVSCEAERQIEGSADALKCLRCNGGASIITGGEWYQIASKRSEPDGQECVRPDTLKLGDHAFSIDSETVASEMREEMLDFMEAYNGQEIPSHFFQYNTTMPDMD